MKGREVLKNIIFWILVIISLMIIYFLILKLMGKSPTALQVVYSLVIGLTFFVFKLGIEIGELKGGFREFKVNVKDGFTRVREDISEIKTDTKEIKQEIHKISKKLK